MQIEIMPYHFEEIIKKGYSLDIIYLLKLIKEQYDVKAFMKESVKLTGLYLTLVRKGLITQEDNKLTIAGDSLLDFLNTKTEVKFVKAKPSESEFDEWWGIFPATDKFEHKGKQFTASRSFKVKKDDCKTQFNKLINEKGFTAREIIEATKFDIQIRKENSFQRKENQLKYLQNSLTYLNQASFQGFVELINEGYVLQESSTNIDGGTDI